MYAKIWRVKPVYQQMTLSPWLGTAGIIILWHVRSPSLILIFISVVFSQTIRDWNALPDSLIFPAEAQNQNCLLVTRQNDNHSPGSGPGRLVPSSQKRSELSNTILSTFSRGDKTAWESGEKATLINISVSNGDLTCHGMIIPAAPNQGDTVSCWYTGFTLHTFVQQYESTVSPPFLEGFLF